MNFVIPMAGRGQRFVDAGYEQPKMLIKAKGKSLLEWSVDSLPLEICTRLIFVLLKEHEETFQLSDFVREKYQGDYEIHFVVLDKVTQGQAETVLKAKMVIDPNLDLVIYNIDTYFHSDTLKGNLLNPEYDGVLGSFIDETNSTKYSFAKTDEEGKIVEVAEKIHISDNALTGMYHFKKASDFITIAEKYLEKRKTSKGEYYVAPMYNDLISQGKALVLDYCNEFATLGTPEELSSFIAGG